MVEQGVTRAKGCRMSVIEAVWQPEQAVKSALIEQSVATANETAATAAEDKAPAIANGNGVAPGPEK